MSFRKEIITAKLYDTVYLAGHMDKTAFNTPVGQNGKTYLHTNMELPCCLPKAKSMIIDSVWLDYPGNTPILVEFTVGSRREFIHPFYKKQVFKMVPFHLESCQNFYVNLSDMRVLKNPNPQEIMVRVYLVGHVLRNVC